MHSRAQNLVINEFLALNENSISDQFGLKQDWIEIYNNSQEPINLLDYCLSDNQDELNKWSFPDTVLASNGYVLVFASGIDVSTSGEELHTNFRIKSSGEALFLSKNGVLVHQSESIHCPSDHSYGSIDNGNTYPIHFVNPTPNYSNGLTATLPDEIHLSISGGFYDEESTLLMSHLQDEYSIYYSIDGSPPDTNSIKYDGSEILLSSMGLGLNLLSNALTCPPYLFNYPGESCCQNGISIKAASFNNYGARMSNVVTQSYFFNEVDDLHEGLPVLSITIDPKDLLDSISGIFVPGVYYDSANPDLTGNYFQKGKDWEKCAHVELMYPNGEKGLDQACGIRTHGASTRRLSHKGLRLYARSEYGNLKFKQKLFKQKSKDSFTELVLKPVSSSWSSSFLETKLCSEFLDSFEIEHSAAEFVVLYINGEYWGLYNLMERINKDYLAGLEDVDPESINVIESWYGGVNEGDGAEFNALVEYIATNDISQTENYNYIASQIDIDNFIDYQLFQIFIANLDWPANNMKCWKSTTAGSKWRWIFFDADASLYQLDFNGFENALSTIPEGWPTNSDATLFLRKFLENEEFNFSFFLRLNQLLNTQLNYDALKEIYEDNTRVISQEISRQLLRFDSSKDYEEWLEKVEELNHFLAFRVCSLKTQVRDFFGEEIQVQSCDLALPYLTKLLVYPNPNNGAFVFSFDSDSATPGWIEVIDISGRRISLEDVLILEGTNNYKLSLAIPKGMYCIHVITAQNHSRTKFVVQ